MAKFVATIPMPPKPKARPRVTKNGTFMPPEYRLWKEEVAMLIMVEGKRQRTEFRGRVKMGVELHKDSFTLTITDTDSKRFGRADIDNLAGAVLDATQDSGIITNDRDVVELWTAFR